MNDKLFKLLKTLLNLSISNPKISKKKLQDLFENRNKIAHGKIVSIAKEEAANGFRTVLTCIIEFEIQKQKNSVTNL